MEPNHTPHWVIERFLTLEIGPNISAIIIFVVIAAWLLVFVMRRK